ncbi:unnamed protein product [Haemonchus placei]|uniref:G_PROTEIN_RECEP_F1_2 domain-containing protein n=1 Tax=Haemonchus placei TaxID=6290 RepID=A0A0N4W7S3_HAEPC|nr:unnamed protein product [Haemonchus placei]
MGIPPVAAFIGATLFNFSSWPDEETDAAFKDIAHSFNQKTSDSFLVATLEFSEGPETTLLQIVKTFTMKLFIAYFILFLIMSFYLMAACCWRIVKEVNKGTSRKIASLQGQLNRLLIAQVLIPFICIHTPFYVCCLAPLFDIDTGIVADYLPILFAWPSVLDPLMVLGFVKDFREYVFSACKKKQKQNSKVFTRSF